jgi:Cu(I)/Ag(I) efflux system membrane protein CusA/SilA
MTYEKLVEQMDAQLQIPGVVNAWTMPIKNRIDMLATGIRTPVGIKIFGADVYQIEAIGKQVEAALKNVPGTRSVFSERVAGGYFLDFEIKRDQLARYGLTVQEVQDVISTAIGGEVISTVIDGRARFGISVRYNRDFRENLPQLKRVLVSTESGSNIPLGQLCEVRFVSGPSMIRDENGSLAGYVYVDVKDRDIGSYVNEAKNIVASQIKLPAGYHLSFSGQYENMQRVSQRLKIVIPLTLLIICLLIYLNTRSSIKTLIVLTAVPFSLVGAVWALFLLDFNISIAVWVGMIALMGLDAETGIFMLLFLDLAHDEAVKNGKMKSIGDLKEAIIHGAVKRIRPKTMTVAAILMGLVPMLWSTGAGADVMKRIAAPMIGGIFSSFVLELLIYPAIYLVWKKREL